MKTMAEYHDLYLKSDVFVLADVLKTSETLAFSTIN